MLNLVYVSDQLADAEVADDAKTGDIGSDMDSHGSFCAFPDFCFVYPLTLCTGPGKKRKRELGPNSLPLPRTLDATRNDIHAFLPGAEIVFESLDDLKSNLQLGVFSRPTYHNLASADAIVPPSILLQATVSRFHPVIEMYLRRLVEIMQSKGESGTCKLIFLVPSDRYPDFPFQSFKVPRGCAHRPIGAPQHKPLVNASTPHLKGMLIRSSLLVLFVNLFASDLCFHSMRRIGGFTKASLQAAVVARGGTWGKSSANGMNRAFPFREACVYPLCSS
jgi:hypothetical protein